MRIKIAFIIVAIVAVLSTILAIYFFLQEQQKITTTSQPQRTTISGTFDINGVIPHGATITLTEKERNATQVGTFASHLPVIDEGPWSFTTAQSGTSYEIQAQVILNGAIIALSSPLDVTAPADDEVLEINIPSQQQTQNAVISGMIDVNGYIPDGASITIEGRKLGQQKFTTIAQGLTGQERQSLSYTKAIGGATYEVQGTLLDKDNQIIGTSNILTITAPALDELLTINSSAQAPAATPTSTPTPPQVTAIPSTMPTTQPSEPIVISGSINFNGAAPPNTRIVIFQKQMNASNYQVAVDNISPTDGITWQWNSPQNATWYTLIAILKQRQSDGTDKDLASSVPMTVAAPAASVVMTINSGFSLSAPGGPITVNCQTYNGGPNQNTWNVIINFQPVNGAGSYWYQVGSTNGANDVANSAGPTTTLNAVFKNNTTYYARYAYATASVALPGSTQYSGFSSTTPLQCSH